MKEISLREKYLKLLGKACKNRSLRKYATDFFDDLCERYEGRVFLSSDFATQIVDGQEFRQDVVVDLVERQGGATMPEIYVYLFEKNVKKIKFHKKFEGAVDGDNDFASKTVRIKTSSIKEHYKPQKVMPRSVGYSPDMPKAEYDRLCRIEAKKAKNAQKEENKRAWRKAVIEWKECHRHVMYHELAHVDELETYGGRRFVGNHFCSDERFVRENENKYQLATASFYISSAELDEEEFDDKKQLPIDQVLTGLIRQGKVAISEIFNEEFACEVEGTLKLQEPQRLIMEITPENQTIFYGRKRELAGNCDYNRNYDFACMTRAIMGDLDFKGARFNSKEAIRRINNANVDMEFVRRRIGEMLDKAISLAPPPEKVTVFKTNGKKEEVTLRGDAEIFEFCKSKLGDMNFYQALCLCFGAPTIAQRSSCKAYQDFLAPEVRKLTQEILIDAIVTQEDKERLERMKRQYEEAMERERLWREEWEKKHPRKAEEKQPQIEEETASAEEGDDENELF